MAGLVPAIHGFLAAALKTWMPGTSPGMTVIKLLRCEYASPLIPRSPFFCATRALLGESCDEGGKESRERTHGHDDERRGAVGGAA
jgi:hypothetical protein